MRAIRTTSWFSRFAKKVAHWTGTPPAFGIAVAVILAWGITGPLFNYSDTWQLVINTSTTVITFLMVFLIQNTQNRDSEALQVKIDELIRSTNGAHNALLDLEELDEKQLDIIRRNYEQLAADARARLQQGGRDTNVPNVAPLPPR